MQDFQGRNVKERAGDNEDSSELQRDEVINNQVADEIF